MRLIDADAIVQKMVTHGEAIGDYCLGLHEGFDICRKLVDNAPTIDAVPVVHCGECRYLSSYGQCETMMAKGMPKPFMMKTDYCSYGVKKDGEPHPCTYDE